MSDELGIVLVGVGPYPCCDHCQHCDERRDCPTCRLGGHANACEPGCPGSVSVGPTKEGKQ